MTVTELYGKQVDLDSVGATAADAAAAVSPGGKPGKGKRRGGR